MTTPYLVLFDADHIKSYVFATGRLKEIRGASEQVRRLTDANTTYLAPTFKQFGLPFWHPGSDDGIIYASGGAGAVLCSTEQQAREFCTELEREFRQQTGGATLSAVWEPVRYDTEEHAEYRAQTRAAQKLAQRKASRPHAELIPGDVLRFCDSDRLRPAIKPISEPDGETLFASASTANKRWNNRRYRDRLLESPVWRAFEAHLAPADLIPWRNAINPTQDLDTIANYARPSGYVALVYGDGDGIGRMLREVVKQAGFLGYRTFSQALTDGATQATAAALAEAYGSHSPSDAGLPFEVITVGGDDVILVCTAEHGLAIARTLSARFGELVKAYAEQAPDPLTVPKPPTMSVGVVIAHASLPMVQLERRGRELLNSAKTLEDGAGIDFHIVSTPALDTIATVRKRDYRISDNTGLTKRPYTRVETETLLHYARYLRGFCDSNNLTRSFLARSQPEQIARLPALPGSKRAALYEACLSDRIQATLDVLTIHLRLRPMEREGLTQALIRLGCGKPYPYAVFADEPRYRTALIDLLEVMEFVAEEGQWAMLSS